MLSALNQGSIIHILDKTQGLVYKTGEIIAISQPKFGLGTTTQTYVDVKVKVGDNVMDFNSIPSSSSVISYNNGKLVLSETKQGLQTEIENVLQNSKQILDNIETYKKNIEECENILKQLNPQFAKDKERDDRIDALDSKFGQMQNSLDQILGILAKSNSGQDESNNN
mgnify:CR=1 FL=1